MSDIPGDTSEVLRVICRTYKMPLAQIWTPTTCRAAIGNPEKKKGSKVDLQCSLEHWPKYLDGNNQLNQTLVKFDEFCHYSCLVQGLGVVGKAFQRRMPCFCKDISQLPISEYPFSDYARQCGLTGYFAICLDTTSSIRTRSRTPDYVLEFFLPETISGEMQTLLGPLLTTLKKDLQGLSVYSGLGESCVEVVNLSVNAKEPDTLKIWLSPGIQSKSEFFPHKNDERTSRHVFPTAESLEEDMRSIDISGDRADKVASSSNSAINECHWPLNASRIPEERSTPLKGKRDVHPSTSDSEQAKEVHDPKKMKFDDTEHAKYVENVSIKAKYGDDLIRFDIPFSSTVTELIDKVTLRLPLIGRPFKIKYQDEEDDWILMACDEDLQNCFSAFRNSDKNRISMMIEPMTN